MKIHNVDQGSLEWLALRAGIPTASEFDALITPLWKIKTGDGPRSYLIAKVAEWFQGGPLPSFQSFAMEQGNFLESEAIPWFELEHNTTIKKVGFITTDDGRAGCSPDGMLSDLEGAEIKCPQADTHVRYLLDGILPKAYEVQVHFSMYVTGAIAWRFISYRRNFPALVLPIDRDREKQDIIHEALAGFLESFHATTKRMEEINGGPPRKLTPMPKAMPHLRPTTTPLAQLYTVGREMPS